MKLGRAHIELFADRDIPGLARSHRLQKTGMRLDDR